MSAYQTNGKVDFVVDVKIRPNTQSGLTRLCIFILKIFWKKIRIWMHKHADVNDDGSVGSSTAKMCEITQKTSLG